MRANSGIKDVPELAGKRVVTAKGSSMEVNMRNAVPSANIITFDTSPQAFVALQQGKAVGYVNEDASLARSLNQIGDKRSEYKILPTNLSGRAWH